MSITFGNLKGGPICLGSTCLSGIILPTSRMLSFDLKPPTRHTHTHITPLSSILSKRLSFSFYLSQPLTSRAQVQVAAFRPNSETTQVAFSLSTILFSLTASYLAVFLNFQQEKNKKIELDLCLAHEKKGG